MLAPVATSILLLLLGACGDPPADPADPGSGPEPGRYEADGTVLESPDHRAELCLGGIAESYPPQCSGLPILDWDWSEVEGEESASGTTWGTFHVVGTYDGRRSRSSRWARTNHQHPHPSTSRLRAPSPPEAGSPWISRARPMPISEP